MITGWLGKSYVYINLTSNSKYLIRDSIVVSVPVVVSVPACRVWTCPVLLCSSRETGVRFPVTERFCCRNDSSLPAYIITNEVNFLSKEICKYLNNNEIYSNEKPLSGLLHQFQPPWDSLGDHRTVMSLHRGSFQLKSLVRGSSRLRDKLL